MLGDGEVIALQGLDLIEQLIENEALTEIEP